MKIALLTDGIYPYVVGGMQKHSYYLAKYLAKHGVHVDLYHCVPYGQPLVETLEGFTNEELKFIDQFCFYFPKGSRYPGHYIVESYAYSKLLYEAFLKYQAVDFVYAQGFTGWYYARQKSAVSLPPLGVNFHGLEMFQKAATLRSRLEQYLFKIPVANVVRQSDYAFSLGGKLTPILERLTKDPQKVIPLSIGIGEGWINDEKVQYNTPNKIRQFVFIGRYERRKGIEELSMVLDRVKESYDFIFHFIGPIPEEKKIFSEKVRYHGLVRSEEKIKQILREADVLVSPSYSEGMPTVILEAMASGCAVIASDVGAVCDEVDESNGWLVRAGDTRQLEETIVSAIEMSFGQLASKKSLSVQKIQNTFLWDDVAERTIAFMQRAIEEKGRR